MAKKKALGKGMMALVDDYNLDNINDMDKKDDGTYGPVLKVSIESVIANRYQPRKNFNEEKLRELANSISERGVIMPVLVADLGDGRYELIAGERRLRASKIAGLDEIPVNIGHFTKDEQLEITLIENIQREDLNAIEVAEAYKELMEAQALTQEELAEHIGKSRASVANTLRLLKLPSVVRQKISAGDLSEGHARAVLSVGELEKMIEFANHIIKNGLSVRQAEKEAKDYQPKKDKKVSRETKKKTDSEIETLTEKLIHALGAKVEISGDREKGRIQIHFFSEDELQNIYQIITRGK